MKQLVDSLLAARDVSTPLLAITTPDQPAVVEGLRAALNGTIPVISWDRARGFLALNDKGLVALTVVANAINIQITDMPAASADPAAAMRYAIHLPKQSVVLALSMDRFLKEPPAGEVVQAVLNLRDAFKSNQRTLIMLAPDFDWPIELRHDVILLDDPLPDESGYATIIRDLYVSAELGKTVKNGKTTYEPTPEVLSKATLAVRGLSTFEAEQVLAMSLALSPKRDGIDLASAWDLKKRAVGKVKGLSMTLDGPSLSDLRGLNQIVGVMDDLFHGPEPPLVIVRVDEIDKSMAGLGSRGGPGDNTGVAQDLHQQFLTTMEDYDWIGAILVGIRGSGKTVLTQSIGAAYGIPTIAMDTGAMKGKHVGESEAAFRDAFRTIRSIGGSRVAVLATANKLDVLPPELIRRFKLNIWYFDLLTKEERDSLWPVYLKRYGHPLDSPRPNDENWTGAEIRNCCEIAYKLRKTVAEVGAKYIVPVTKSDPMSVQDLRKIATDRFLSASYPGTYHPEHTVEPTTAARRLTLGTKES